MADEARRHRTASMHPEQAALATGHQCIVGVDEAGRGPWAGPVVAAAVLLPLDDLARLSTALHGVRDSKQMTAHQREVARQQVEKTAIKFGVGVVDAATISSEGLTRAVERAVVAAIESIAQAGYQPDYLLLDKMRLTAYDKLERANIVRGDQLSLSIAAASIIAKTTRDALMLEVAQKYPDYGFETHKGYGTAQHRAAIERYGVIEDVHRLNYRPIKDILQRKLL